jgi:hypothetical protein
VDREKAEKEHVILRVWEGVTIQGQTLSVWPGMGSLWRYTRRRWSRFRWWQDTSTPREHCKALTCRESQQQQSWTQPVHGVEQPWSRLCGGLFNPVVGRA